MDFLFRVLFCGMVQGALKASTFGNGVSFFNFGKKIPRDFIIFCAMGNLIQTSGFKLAEHDALRMLRQFPLVFAMESTPSLLYRLDSGLQVGGEVSYRLVSGFQIVNWKGTISSIEGSSWKVDLKSGPFSLFHAEHSISAENGLLECFDDISFGGESPDLTRVLESARFQYAFPSRAALIKAAEAFESRRKTESFRAFSSENLSAG